MSTIGCGSTIDNVDELSPEIRQYLYLADNSYYILKYMSDNIEQISSPENSPLEDGSLEPLNKSATLQDGRAPSPASISSLASGRRLEWDSGADVGYQPSSHLNSLSTLERMALGGYPESIIRTDPEGTSSSVVNSRNVIHKTVVKKDSARISEVKQSDNVVSSPREVTGVINLPVFSCNEAVSMKSMKSKSDSDNDSMKIPLSPMGNIGNSSMKISGEDGNQSEWLHKVHPLDSKVKEKPSPEREILTSLANVVPALSGSSSSLASTIIPHNASGSRPPSSKTSKPIEKGIQVGGTLNKQKAVQPGETSLSNTPTNEDEIVVKATQTGLSFAKNNDKTSLKKGQESIENSSFDYANSFEYFPGDAYDMNGEGKSEMKENVQLNANNPRKIHNSLSEDLEDNIGRIREVLHEKRVGSEERKILIKKLVERIVGSEYFDDDEKSSSDKSSVSCDSVIKVLPAKNHQCPSAKPKENMEVKSEKLYVPYRPVPGGRIYHVAKESIHREGYQSSTSYCESDDSRPKTYFLPVDRIRVTQHSYSSSDKRESSPVFGECPERKTYEHKSRANVGRDYGVSREHQKVEGILTTERKNHKAKVDRDKPCCSRECATKRNWWSPVTKSEKSRLSLSVRSKPNPLFNYAERERANQLHWIKNEIQHLSSLAQLLEDCAVIKSETSTSVEDQMSILSSLTSKKDAKNVVNSTDRYSSSSRSTPIEEPISATVHWHRSLPKKKSSRPLSPPVHDTSLQVPSPKMESTQSSDSSSSQTLHSKSHSRIESNLKEMHIPRSFANRSGKKQSEAYVITFEEVSPDKKIGNQKEIDARKSLKEVRLKVPVKQCKNVREAIKSHGLKTLQEQLEVCRPSFIKSTEERQKCLEELARLRSLRQMTRRKLLHFTLSAWEDPLAHNNNHLKQNISKPKPVHSAPKNKHTGKCKGNDNQICPRMKKHRIFPEMQKKEAERIKKQNQQTNRIMADLFARRLQKKVLHGAVSLSNSVSVISSL